MSNFLNFAGNSIGDQLDALWKGGDDQAAMKVIVDKVKSDNPK